MASSLASPMTSSFSKADFAELPSLEDEEIVEYLLPVALAWSKHPDSARRQRLTTILALMDTYDAEEALSRLQADPHPLVAAGTRRAAEQVRRAWKPAPRQQTLILAR